MAKGFADLVVRGLINTFRVCSYLCSQCFIRYTYVIIKVVIKNGIMA